MGKDFLRKHRKADRKKRHLGLDGLRLSAVDRNIPRLLRPVLIVEADLQVSAPAGQRFRPDGLAVQCITDFYPYREFAPALSLIVDLFPVVFPDQAAVSSLAEFLVAFGVLDVGKPRAVDNGPVRSAVTQQRLHRHVVDHTVCTGLDIDGLLLISVCLFLLCVSAGVLARCRSRVCRGGWTRRRRGGRTRRRRHLRLRIRQVFQRAAAYQKRTAEERQ